MNDKLHKREEIEEALKIAAVLDEPEEYHIPVKTFEGLTLDVLINSYASVQINSYLDEIQVEIITEVGTVFCNLKEKICVQANLFPNDEVSKREKDYEQIIKHISVVRVDVSPLD